MSDVILHAPVLLDQYPMQQNAALTRLDAAFLSLRRHLPGQAWRQRRRLARFIATVTAHETSLRSVATAKLRAQIPELRYQLRRDGFDSAVVPRAFALIRECSHRTLGLRHFDEQIAAGGILLRAAIVELATGEGKTLAATLAAGTAALAGIPVHVVTVNDYLAKRDADIVTPVFAELGLRVGVATQSQSDDERRHAYAADIVYVAHQVLAFDHLRDRMALAARQDSLGSPGTKAPLFLRGLQFAIVDEADSVLIDDAQTPLVIAQDHPATGEDALYEHALALARQLVHGSDYVVHSVARRVDLTPAGEARLGALRSGRHAYWPGPLRADELIIRALSALHLYQRDRDYLVSDGKVRIIDEATGRLWADRAWEHGLQQLIECKEGCQPTDPRETHARSSYQRIFSRYLHLCGMTGTAREVTQELGRTYGLEVTTVPSRVPCRRHHLAPRLYACRTSKLNGLISEAEAVHRMQRPVLIGTRTVADSEHISARLHTAGLSHQLLNARHDQEEAALIAVAGAAGCITVATNMAGRGTDIKLCPAAYQAGGLHVILAELNASRRVDRQLFGRCARQGDPGSVVAIVSLEDASFSETFPAWLLALLGRIWPAQPLPAGVARTMAYLSQSRQERDRARQRQALLQADETQTRRLACFGMKNY